MSIPAEADNRWRSIAPSVFVLAVGIATVGVFGIVTCGVGAWWCHDEGYLRPDRPPSDYEAHIWCAMDYAINSSEENDVVFIGDSTCLCGIRTRQFERISGLKAYNIATVGAVGIDACAIVLGHYLEHHRKPRAVVFSMCPWALGVPPSSTGPEDARSGFLRAYAPQAAAGPVARYERACYFVRRGARLLSGEDFGSAADFADTPLPARGGATFRTLCKQVRDERGFWEHPGALEKGVGRPADRDLPSSLWPANRHEILGLARLAAEHDIPLLFRLTPALGAVEEPFEALHASLKILYEECPTMIPSRPDLLFYDGPYFGQTLHLNGRGADRFTEFVAGEVTRVLRDGSTADEKKDEPQR